MAIFEYNEEKHMEQERSEAEERGRRDGLREGEERGRQEGEERLGKLITELMNVGRMEDVKEVAQNPEVREKLYKEYNIE